jgi:hypothetical protein
MLRLNEAASMAGDAVVTKSSGSATLFAERVAITCFAA